MSSRCSTCKASTSPAAVLESDQHLEELFALIDEQPLPKGWQLVDMSSMPLQDTLNVLTHPTEPSSASLTCCALQPFTRIHFERPVAPRTSSMPLRGTRKR